MPRPEPHRTLSDDQLQDAVGAVFDEDEPLPPGAIEFAAGAFSWRDMEGELAELLHDSLLEEAVALRAEPSTRLLLFRAGDLTLDLEHGPDGLAGSVSPAAIYDVEVHHAASDADQHPKVRVRTDSAGMFRLGREIGGTVRFVVRHLESRLSLLSPWTTL